MNKHKVQMNYKIDIQNFTKKNCWKLEFVSYAIGSFVSMLILVLMIDIHLYILLLFNYNV